MNRLHALVAPLKMRDPRGPFALSNFEVEDVKAIRLPLGGAGIRSIEYDGQSNAFRILTGAAADGEKTDFKLWEWNGDPSQPTLSESDTFDRTLKPEGVTRFTSGDRAFTFIVFDTSGYTVIE